MTLPGNKVFTLRESAFLRAPLDRCFLLSTSLEIVHRELGMNAVSGRTHGLAQANDVVRWEGWQLGWWHYHVSRIDHFDPPTFFQDKMIEGRFEFFEHDHHLRATAGGTVLEDELRFSLPFGVLGQIVARSIMVPHIRGLMRKRFAILKGIAEGGDWPQYLPPQPQEAVATR